MPRSPRLTSMGSPGTRRISMKVMNIKATKVGSVIAARLRMKPSMACHPALQAIRLSAGGETDDATMGLFYNIDAEELMATERRDLVAFHLLAYRLEHRRMGDGEPGSLFLEDLLHIFVDRGTLLLVRQGTRLEQRVIELLVAPLRDVLRVRLAIGAAAEKEEEVVGIAIVTGP